MTAPAGLAPDDRLSGGHATLWLAAAVVAATAHVGGALWALQRPASTAPSDAAPAAVMIELAPEPAAPEAEQAITPDAADAPDVPDAMDQPTPPQPTEMADLPTPETPPPPTLAPPEVVETPVDTPPPPDQTIEPPPVLSEVAIARPLARRETPPPPPAEKPDPKPVREAKEKPSQAARKAAVDAPPADKAAAPKTSAGGAGSVSPRKWQTQLIAHLERRKRYPTAARGRGEEGVVYVRFTVDGQGQVLSVALARSSGFPDLDEAVLALVRRASPLPPPPPGIPRDVTAPVRFNIR